MDSLFALTAVAVVENTLKRLIVWQSHITVAGIVQPRSHFLMEREGFMTDHIGSC